MSTWNYRILAFEYPEQTTFSICEVHYDNNGKPDGYADSFTKGFESLDNIRKEILYYQEAVEKPILYGGNKFPKEYTNNV